MSDILAWNEPADKAVSSVSCAVVILEEQLQTSQGGCTSREALHHLPHALQIAVAGWDLVSTDVISSRGGEQ